MGKKPLGIYIHIPFCVRKCPYCDFPSLGIGFEDSEDSERMKREYTNSLCEEIEREADLYSDFYEVDSIYIGGGTPSLMRGEQTRDILNKVGESFFVAADCETSIEMNPVSSPKLLDFLSGLQLPSGAIPESEFAGRIGDGVGFASAPGRIIPQINRVSLGVQSFDGGMLAALRRPHGVDEVHRSIEMLRGAGDIRNISLDLMFGLPGQTLEIWEDTVRRAIEAMPEHISFYSLQIEEGTDFYRSYRRGHLGLPSPETDRAMYRGAVEMLAYAGYERYEVSSAAEEGFACRHNLKYWTMGDYLGFGAGAHSYRSADVLLPGEKDTGFGRRRENPFRPEDFEVLSVNDRRENDPYPMLYRPGIWEENDFGDEEGDFFFTTLRTVRGLSVSEYEMRFGRDIFSAKGKEIDELSAAGLLELAGDRLRFTDAGFDSTNAVISKLLNG